MLEQICSDTLIIVEASKTMAVKVQIELTVVFIVITLRSFVSGYPRSAARSGSLTTKSTRPPITTTPGE